MKKFMKKLHAIATLSCLLGAINMVLCLCVHASGTEAVRQVDLRCENLTNPVGIDETEPRLSWRLKSEVSGEKQTAYHVLVASSRDGCEKGIGDLWDSGKVDSEQSIHVAYSGNPLISKMTCYWKVRTWDKEGRPSVWSETSNWAMGLLKPGDWSAQWIGPPAMPIDTDGVTIKKASYQTLDGGVAVDVTEIVRKELDKDKPFEVHFKTLGGDPAPGLVKELVVDYVRNGQSGIARARDFKPLSLSDSPGEPAPLFRKEFDLAAAPSSARITVHSPAYFELFINGSKVGKDVLTPAVSNLDLQSFSVTYDVSQHLRPGNNCMGLWLGKGWAKSIAVRAQLDAVVAGQPITIGTDTSWKTRNSGLYKIGGWKWSDFGGELLDAREIVLDWSLSGLDTSSWSPAEPVTVRLGSVRNQPCPLNRIGKVISPVAITPQDGGRYLVDFGVALTGWLRLEMPMLQAGTNVKMTSSDVVRGKHYQHFNQVSRFISAGKAGEVFENKFNYAGFRYVMIEGLPSAPAKEDVTAMLIESDLEEVGSFECSKELFNRIHQVNQWTQRALNLGGYYVDCPHRERRGYGDGQVATEGFMTSFRADGFYRKWLRDWRVMQDSHGRLKNTAPSGLGGGGPGWGGLLSAITWRHYLYYGDRRILEENYNAISRYVAFLETKCKDDVLRAYGGSMGFIGDWVPPRRGMNTKNWPSVAATEIFNNCYRINQMELLKQMAVVLGKSSDVARYSELLAEIRPKVHAAFYDAEKQQYVIDEQAYYIMPLMTGVAPEAERAALLKNLEQNILVKNQGHLDTGMLGTYFMMETLRELGRNDLVYTMFNQTTYPGWGNMLAKGATTFWEQWDGHWSRIHSCFTSPDNWLYQGLAGIQGDPEAPGFKNVIIKPAFVGDLTWVKAHHDSPYGRIVSNWKRENGRVTMKVTIPANSTATVYVPANAMAEVTESGRSLDQVPSVEFLRMENGRAVLSVAAGNYSFSHY